MPESAIGGLVEGLLQGHAIKQQKQQEAYQRERDHATDIFNQHAQTWRETTSAASAKDSAAQQTFDNRLATDRASLAAQEEARKVSADKQRKEAADAVVNAKTDKQRQDAFLKLYLTGDTAGSASQLSGMALPGQSPAPQVGGAQSALGILNSAGQGQPAPGASVGGAKPPSVLDLMPPVGTVMERMPRVPGFNPDALNPKAAADIKAKQAHADLAQARIPLLKTEDLNKLSQIAHRKAMDENAKETRKLTDARIGLTHAQTERTKALAEIEPSLKMAQVNLANARAASEIARREYIGVQEQHVKLIDHLKSSGNDIADYKKRGDVMKQAKDAENKFTHDRYAQEKAREKIFATITSYNDTAQIDPNTVEKPLEKAAIKVAHDMLPQLRQDLKDADARIANIKAQEKEAHRYVVNTTTYLNKNGTEKVYATDTERQAAESAARDAQSAADAARRAASKSGTRIPHVPDYNSTPSPPHKSQQGVPLPGMRQQNGRSVLPPKGSKIIEYGLDGNPK